MEWLSAILTMPTHTELEIVRCYVSSVKWQFAKTMAHTPHEYTLRKWRKDLDADFVYFVQFIRQYGYPKQWGSAIYTYFDLDGYKYWTMGASIAQTILINREKLLRNSLKGT